MNKDLISRAEFRRSLMIWAEKTSHRRRVWRL